MTALGERPVAVVRRDGRQPAQPPQPTRRDRLGGYVSRHRATLAWLGPVLLVAAVVQAVNLGGSPQRIDDEGTYTAQAWAISHLGELAHYTYWYDHPPLGWVQIAAYTSLTGAFDRYDIAVVAAREAMVVAALISLVLLWSIARRIGLSRPASAAAGIVFALSPLAVQFHRTVYLDNVATPWLLASILLALTRRNQLAGFAGSAAALGIAVLSKETYLLALPVVAWLMWRNAQPETRRYTLSVAATLLAIIGGGYLLLAAVKGELAPGPDRVSLWEGILFQLGSRDSSGSVLDPTSLFSATTSVWFQLDPVLTILGPVAALAGLFVRRIRPFAAMLVFLIAFMFRPGGYLPVPYVVMMLPFAALVIAAVTDAAIRSLRVRTGARRTPNLVWLVALATAAAVLVPSWAVQLRGLLLSDLDQPSREAQSWVEQNVPGDSRLIVDDAMWVDLVEAGFPRDDVIWFYKLDTDPAVQAQSPNGWRDSDFIITTDSMVSSPNAQAATAAIENSTVVATFGQGDQQVEVRRIHPEGTEAEAAEAQDEVDLRTSVGLEVSANPALTASSEDLARFDAGQVDPRISILLGQLLAEGEVTVAGLPIVPGEEGLAFRQVLISDVAGDPLVADGRLTDAADRLVTSVPGRYAPESASAGGTDLLLTYSVIAPGNLVQ